MVLCDGGLPLSNVLDRKDVGLGHLLATASVGRRCAGVRSSGRGCDNEACKLTLDESIQLGCVLDLALVIELDLADLV